MGKAVFLRAAALVLVAGMLVACGRDTPEAEVRAQLAALEEAIERRDVGDLRGLLSEDFVGNAGEDREGAMRFAQLGFLRYGDVRVVMGPSEVEVNDGRALVRGTVGLAGGSGRLPETGRLYDVTMGWREEGGEWRLLSLEWEGR